MQFKAGVIFGGAYHKVSEYYDTHLIERRLQICVHYAGLVYSSNKPDRLL